VGALGLHEWSTPQLSTVTGDFDLTRVQQALDRSRPDSRPRRAVCDQLITTLGAPVATTDVVADEFAVRLASAAALAMSSDDATLRAFGAGARDALRLREVRRSTAGITAALHYCAATEGQS
jgi:hypothetical protein